MTDLSLSSASTPVFSSTLLPPSRVAGLPHFVQRAGMGAIMAGAGWAMTHDSENGLGIATGASQNSAENWDAAHFAPVAWPLTYLVLNIKSSLKSRSFAPLLLLTSTAACGALYSGEYFFFRANDRMEAARRHRAPPKFDAT